MATIKVTQVKSLIGCPKDQRGTIKALGLKRIRHSVEKTDSAVIRGMIHKVSHLILVETVTKQKQKEAPGSDAKSAG